MFSGRTITLEISSIVVNPGRQRKQLSGIDELAQSLSAIGLINPITVTPDGVLVAGERRLTAAKSLGWSHIEARQTIDLPSEELEIIELEENVKRKDLTWREEVSAIARYHALRLSADPSWTAQMTAENLSISATTASEAIGLQAFVDAGDQLICNADTYTTARNIMQRKRQRAQQEADENVEALVASAFNTPSSPANSAGSSSDASTDENATPAKLPGGEAAQARSAPSVVPFLNVDFRDWVAQPYLGQKFNFVHCDFPYGINYDKHNGGATGTFGGYDDSRDAFEVCMDALYLAMETHIAPSAHLLFWFSARLDLLFPVYQRLEAMGWRMTPTPVIWHRSDNSGILPDPKRGPRQIYETALIGSRGDRFIAQPVSNLYAFPKTKEIHASEKPREMLAHFFRMFVDESTVMLDPTMGSGNSVCVAEAMGAKQVLGLEREPEFYESARRAYLQRKKDEAV